MMRDYHTIPGLSSLSILKVFSKPSGGEYRFSYMTAGRETQGGVTGGLGVVAAVLVVGGEVVVMVVTMVTITVLVSVDVIVANLVAAKVAVTVTVRAPPM